MSIKRRGCLLFLIITVEMVCLCSAILPAGGDSNAYTEMVSDPTIGLHARMQNLGGKVQISATEYFNDSKTVSLRITDFIELQPLRTEETPPLLLHGMENTSSNMWRAAIKTKEYPGTNVSCHWWGLASAFYNTHLRLRRIMGRVYIDLFIFRESSEIQNNVNQTVQVRQGEIWFNIRLQDFSFCKEGMVNFDVECANLTSTGMLLGMELGGTDNHRNDPREDQWVEFGAGRIWFDREGLYDGEVLEHPAVGVSPSNPKRVELNLHNFEESMTTRIALRVGGKKRSGSLTGEKSWDKDVSNGNSLVKLSDSVLLLLPMGLLQMLVYTTL